MKQNINLKILPSEAANDGVVKEMIAKTIGKEEKSITGYHINKKSIDARGKTIWVNLSLTAFIDEPFYKTKAVAFEFKNVAQAKNKVIIIGAGPAGLFAALQLIELGIKPVLLERGKDVRARRRDLAILSRDGIINPDSNYCFGEGGAGTYSDGKLYTRSNKRGNIERILNLFVYFGADENILYEAHPHIGTNKLPAIITAMREKIESCGGEFLFEKKVTDILFKGIEVNAVKTADGNCFEADAFILATGHSAHDIFELLHSKKILVEAKPFALGVRVEHSQSLIDTMQYHHPIRSEFLPAASYSLVHQVNGRGVFSFCMCPGGIIAPAATSAGQLVVNGWSPSKRNNPFANSGMVVQVELNDVLKKKIINTSGELAMLQFQQYVEEKSFAAGGGKFVAPAQRMVDFSKGKLSTNLPNCSYQPGLRSAPLNEVLPEFIYDALAKGFIAFGKKVKGYFTNEAIVVATESRTSSPVRIPRDSETLTHPQFNNFYPCAEGAGYAGGIVSAAMDGERVAKQLSMVLIG